MRVFISAPYSIGDQVLNVRNAILAGEELLSKGYDPYIPHLTHFWHLLCPHEPQVWYDLDNAFLPLCDCLLRLPGESVGADNEVKLAEELGLPVYYSVENVLTR